MKKKIIILCMALAWTVTLMAQEISVVTSNGSTQLYTSLTKAIEGAANNSTIYLPGGRFAIHDSVRITKPLTIIGIGHYMNNEENEDGRTFIDGHLSFDEGSSGSSVMGCYLEKSINIGTNLGHEYESTVNDFTLRYCNVWDICVSSSSTGTVINQNYVRAIIYFNNSSGEVSNNIMGAINDMGGGSICNNVFTVRQTYTLRNVSNTTVSDNAFVIWNGHYGSGLSAYHNLFFGVEWGDDCLNLTGVDRNDVFIKNDGVASTSNYHFQTDYKQYESQYGIYSGTGFKDKQMAPVPYIVAKRIDGQTDASGKLNIKIRVKAGE